MNDNIKYKYVLNVAFVGPYFCGKTSLINALKKIKFSDIYIPTIGVKFEKIQCQKYIIHTWDISGLSKFKFLIGSQCRICEIIFLCYENNNINSLYDMINIYKDNIDDFKDKKIVILKTKSDLQNKLDLFCVDLKLEEFNHKNYFDVIETSSKDKRNLIKILNIIIKFASDLDNYLIKNNENISLLNLDHYKNNNLDKLKNCCKIS